MRALLSLYVCLATTVLLAGAADVPTLVKNQTDVVAEREQERMIPIPEESSWKSMFERMKAKAKKLLNSYALFEEFQVSENPVDTLRSPNMVLLMERFSKTSKDMRKLSRHFTKKYGDSLMADVLVLERDSEDEATSEIAATLLEHQLEGYLQQKPPLSGDKVFEKLWPNIDNFGYDDEKLSPIKSLLAMALLPLVVLIGACLRGFLYAIPSIPAALSSRPELVTPISSFYRLREGVFLYDSTGSPYSGDVYHQPPLLFAFLYPVFQVVPVSLQYLVICGIFISIDLLLGMGFARLCAKTLKLEEGRKFMIQGHETWLSQIPVSPLFTPENLPTTVAFIYLMNPYSLASSLAMSTVSLTHLAILYSLLFASEGLDGRYFDKLRNYQFHILLCFFWV
ncbi:hypothetical protein PsorP6_006588 [Peronosclerospora sorghi]|uniref:Uncharacterized protein n=1 Tax=Peronosclerospora sorghi TaxID=230839 RepID=A0ACC0W547_9STRA|nr:hypothetical protein PsorP6_006588 [Peronosclerospora sorghi]